VVGGALSDTALLRVRMEDGHDGRLRSSDTDTT
jgi:hypothetical protein